MKSSPALLIPDIRIPPARGVQSEVLTPPLNRGAMHQRQPLLPPRPARLLFERAPRQRGQRIVKVPRHGHRPPVHDARGGVVRGVLRIHCVEQLFGAPAVGKGVAPCVGEAVVPQVRVVGAVDLKGEAQGVGIASVRPPEEPDGSGPRERAVRVAAAILAPKV